MTNSEQSNVTASSGVTITLDDYRDVGALDEALSTHADEVLRSLTAEQQRIAEVLFRRLTERGDGRRDRRRPSRLGDVAKVADVKTDEVVAVVEEFRKPDRSFITPPYGSPLRPETVLDISHESLISLWDTLDGWVGEEARSAAAYDRLKKTAHLWDAKDAELWGGITLERALTWKKRQQPTLAWARRYGADEDYALAMKFLGTSETKWLEDQQKEATRLERELQEAETERQRLVEEARTARRFKLLAAALGLVGIMAVAAAGFAYSKSKAEAKQRDLATASLIEVQKQKTFAEDKHNEAKEQRQKAEEATIDAEKQKDMAEASALEARKQAELAKALAAEANRQRMLAEAKGKDAERLARIAAGLAVEAKKQKDLAIKNEQKANKLKEIADEASAEARKQKGIAEGYLQKATEQLALVTDIRDSPETTVTTATGNAVLRLKIVDVSGRLLNDQVTVTLNSPSLSNPVTARFNASTLADVTGVAPGAQGITISSGSYLTVNQFVSIKPVGKTELTVTLPIDPAKVKRVDFLPFQQLPLEARLVLEHSNHVLNFENRSGKALYETLDDIRKAGLLNIIALARATRLNNGQNVLQFVKEIIEIRGDRFFAVVAKELRDEAKGTFTPVDASLHRPRPGFQQAGSFKTKDLYGSLQLTFFVEKDVYFADIDIDDKGGLGHIFQVNRSSFTNRRTHPYDIHEILVTYQKIDPGYRLIP